MDLGIFMMPLHRADKPWKQALEEDRELVLLCEELAFSEVWIGEHFTTRAEGIPSAMMFLATVIAQTRRIRFGTGVVNLPHHHPAMVAAEAAMFDQLSDGRLMLGIGPGGLVSDAEMFGHEDVPERVAMTLEAVDMMLQLWQQHAPLKIEGRYYNATLENNIWPAHGIGTLCHPLQQPHPPLAMAMVSPGGRTAEIIAERDFIPISSNFVPLEHVEAQWQCYSETRQRLGKPVDRDLWRVGRNILVTDSDARAADIVDDPDSVFAHYFRYLRGTRRIQELWDLRDAGPQVLNPILEVDKAIEDCVIAGSVETVTARLIEVVERLGPFGTLLCIGHDNDAATPELWPDSMRRLAREVMPRVRQHAASLAA
ncbi:MAG: LLM class flavin-dependent oxidoreductase [Gammaproteobacteria bacterium]|nr:LLM class flavin-dependent oxidoreductase [Gammaproteobacteria bacterium]